MKLHPKKRKPSKVADDSWLHCCRYCHHYLNGVCMNSEVSSETALEYGDWFNSICEDGVVQEVLEEDLMTEERWRSFEVDLEDVLIKKLGYSPSQKKLETFKKEFEACYEIFVRDAVVYLDKALNYRLSDCQSESFGVSYVIKNPTEQVCNLWE